MNRAAALRLTTYLDHIRQAIGRCQTYVAGMDEAAFLADPKTQDAVIRAFEVMGEAANNVKKHFPDFAQQHPEFPFARVIGMRNALSHGYFTVDLAIVWKAIHADLPPLLVTVQALSDAQGQA